MPQVLEEIVALVACRRQATARCGRALRLSLAERQATARVDVHCACRLQAPGDSTGGRALVGKQIVDGPVPQIQEKIVEVIKVMLREQCQ